jgi:hypothetical protein
VYLREAGIDRFGLPARRAWVANGITISGYAISSKRPYSDKGVLKKNSAAAQLKKGALGLAT